MTDDYDDTVMHMVRYPFYSGPTFTLTFTIEAPPDLYLDACLGATGDYLEYECGRSL